MQTEYDENVLDYWKLSNGVYILKMKKHEELHCDIDVKNAIPRPLKAFLLSNSKRYMNIFIRDID